MRLCSYVVMIDKGFAPNPFWGFCTLAACTPNHQGCTFGRNDWMLGNSSANTGRRLIYAMRISEVLDFDDYYRDQRFAGKRARAGSWRERCGDNIYFRNGAGEWEQALAFYHTCPRDIEKDTRNPCVFISDHFFYFGENAPARSDLPVEYASLVNTGISHRHHEGESVHAFIEWLEQTHQPGLHGLPRDREEETGAQCGLVHTRSVVRRTSGCS